jgi:hypothetical protein
MRAPKAPKVRSGARCLLTVSLSRFYSQAANLKEVLPYVDGTSDISLRLIDWFVTNYAKKHNVVLLSKSAAHFNVYLSYRSQLKAYSKQQFDPFRRRDRLTFYYDTRGGAIETTIGQLNFFRWMLTNNVLAYVRDHVDLVEADMVASQKAEAAAAAARPDDTQDDPHPEDEITHASACEQTQQAAPPDPAADATSRQRRARASAKAKRKEISTFEAVTHMTRVQGDCTMLFE